MADRSVVVRLRAQVDQYKRGLQDAAKAADALGDRTDAAGKAIDRQADAARRAAQAAGYAKDAQGRWRDEKGKFVTVAERERLGLDKTTASTQSASTALSRMAKSARDNRAEWEHLGRGFTVAGVGIAGALALSTREAIKWESAFAGVRKTTDGSPQEMAALEGELRQLAKTLPATHEEIAATAEAAGQLGVGRDDIAAFTKTAIDMGESTNLSAEEAATGLAQLGNVMGVLPDDADRAGAALVDLGNNGASTEQDILAMSLRLAGAGKTIGATEADVLGLASGLANVGIEAEAGGSALSRVMVDIAQSVETGNSKLDTFAEVAGLSTEEFSAAFRDDAAGAVVTFVEGLGRMQASGESVFGTLDELELSEIRVRDALLRTAGAGDMLRESLDLGSQAWGANTALVDEANARYETSAARIATARNQLSDAAIDLGGTFVPLVADGAEAVAGIVSTFSDLPQGAQTAAGAIAAVTGGLSLALGGALLFVPRAVETYDALNKMGPAGQKAATGLRRVGTAAGTALTVYAVARGVVELADAVGDAGEVMRANALEQGIERVANGDLSGINEQFDQFGSSLVRTAPEVDGVTGALDRLFAPQMWQRSLDWFQGVEEGVFGTRSEVGQLEDRFAGLDEQLATMVSGGQGEAAAEFFGQITAYADEQGYSLERLNGMFPAYGDALLGADGAQQAAATSGQGAAAAIASIAGAVTTTGGAAMGLPTSFQMMLEQMQASDEQASELRDEFMELGETMLAFVDPLGAYTILLEQKQEADRVAAEAQAAATDSQEDSWRDYVGSVTVSVGEYLAQLEKQQADQLNWKTNMLKLSGQVSQGTLDELARMGPEGAPLVAQLVNASDAELQRLDDVFAGNAEDAVFDWGEKIRLAGPVLAQIAATAGEGAANAAAEKLAAGTATIEDIAADYGVALAKGVNPVLTSIGKSEIKLNARTKRTAGDGRSYTGYAQGGFHEDHVAQIAPAGAWRTWAEPETGGEALPLLVTRHRLRLEQPA